MTTYIGSRVINSEGLVAAGIDWMTNSLWDHWEFWFDAEIMPTVLAILKKHGMPANYPLEGGYLGAHAGSGIEFRALDYTKPSREHRYRNECTPEQLEAFVVSAFGKVGTLYNYLAILGIAARIRGLTASTREICTEFGFDELNKVWFNDVLNALSEYRHLITPETLHLSPIFAGRCVFSSPPMAIPTH